MLVFFNKYILNFFLVLFLLFTLEKTYAENGPTLLQNKKDKKEKLREEELVTKEIKINELMINQFINLDES